jgi:hypothetical protein
MSTNAIEDRVSALQVKDVQCQIFSNITSILDISNMIQGLSSKEDTETLAVFYTCVKHIDIGSLKLNNRGESTTYDLIEVYDKFSEFISRFPTLKTINLNLVFDATNMRPDITASRLLFFILNEKVKDYRITLLNRREILDNFSIQLTSNLARGFHLGLQRRNKKYYTFVNKIYHIMEYDQKKNSSDYLPLDYDFEEDNDKIVDNSVSFLPSNVNVTFIDPAPDYCFNNKIKIIISHSWNLLLSCLYANIGYNSIHDVILLVNSDDDLSPDDLSDDYVFPFVVNFTVNRYNFIPGLYSTMFPNVETWTKI